MTRVRGRAISAALALAAASATWILAGASPAVAYVCAFSIESPGNGSVSASPTVRVSGPFAVRHGLADRSLEITVIGSPGPRPAPILRSGADVGPAGRYDVPLGPLGWNGEYTVRVRALHSGTSPVLNCDDGLGPERRDTEMAAEVRFAVSVRARPPGNVVAHLDTGPRRVTVTWGPSPDPDVARYIVAKRVGSAEPTTRLLGAEARSWTDTDLPREAATITYAVQALRAGPRADTFAEASPTVAAGPIEVPAAPVPPTTAPPGTTVGGGAVGTTTPGTTASTSGGPGGGTPSFEGLSPLTVPGGLSGSDGAPAALAAPVDEGGYQPLLPYPMPGFRTPGIEAPGDQAVVGPARGGGGDGTPQLAYVASGLLSSVVAAHVLWLRRQSLRPRLAHPADGQASLEPLPVAAAAPRRRHQRRAARTAGSDPPEAPEAPAAGAARDLGVAEGAITMAGTAPAAPRRGSDGGRRRPLRAERPVSAGRRQPREAESPFAPDEPVAGPPAPRPVLADRPRPRAPRATPGGVILVPPREGRLTTTAGTPSRRRPRRPARPPARPVEPSARQVASQAEHDETERHARERHPPEGPAPDGRPVLILRPRRPGST